MGPPGSGKGTQSDLLVDSYGYVKISTGDLVRDEITSQSKLGKDIERTVASGSLVDDETIVSLFQNKLFANIGAPFIADGFPRTVSQAVFLKAMLKEYAIDDPLVVFFQLSLEAAEGRILSRRHCGMCGASISVAQNASEVCHHCGNANLLQRSDDSLSIIQKRYAIYESEIDLLLQFYADSVVKIDADQPVEKITTDLLSLGGIVT